jgi:hypothetical protein
MRKNITTETSQQYADRIYHALDAARDLIHIWHNMGQKDIEDDTLWGLYQQSPEMKRINETLTEFE